MYYSLLRLDLPLGAGGSSVQLLERSCRVLLVLQFGKTVQNNHNRVQNPFWWSSQPQAAGWSRALSQRVLGEGLPTAPGTDACPSSPDPKSE